MCFLHIRTHAQSAISDSVKTVLNNTKSDTLKCSILSKLIESEYDDNIWPAYNDEVERICLDNLKREKPESPLYKIYKRHLASAYINRGYLKKQHGEIPVALKYYYDGLKIFEELKDKKGKAETLNNIGFIYKSQSEHGKALECFKQCHELFNETGDKTGIAIALNNIGVAYENSALILTDATKRKELLLLGLDHYTKSLKINQELKNKRGVGQATFNVGYTYLDLGDTARALVEFDKSLVIREELQDKKGLVQTLNAIGEIALNKNNLVSAKTNVERAFNIARENEFAKELEGSGKILSRIYARTGNWKSAYEMHVLFKQMNDSLQNEKNKKDLFQKQFQYQYDKKAAADSVRVAEEKKVTTAQLKQERTQRFALYGGLALVLIFAGFMFNRFKKTQKQNRIINLQKEKVEKQKEEIEHQKELVDEKQKEIVDSINYAKRLQQAILPPSQFIDQHLPSNFVLYKPKDIIAGDFYWMFESEGIVLVAAADSTGHGVPGAMVSIVCSNALEKAVKEFKLREPGEVLDKTTELVLETFAKSGEEIKDGMDVSLLYLDKKNKKIKWAGANNHLWYIVPGAKSEDKPGLVGSPITEIKANKQPVGKSDHQQPFKTNEVEYTEGTVFYLLTDGYADQFGGPKAKKYKYKKLEEKLAEISDLPMTEQKQLLSEDFEKWMGSLEQIDDVTIIGVRI